MFRRCVGVVFVLLALVAPHGPTSTLAAPAPPPPPAWEQLVWWLPEDTETLVVAPGPAEVTRPGPASARWLAVVQRAEAIVTVVVPRCPS